MKASLKKSLANVYGVSDMDHAAGQDLRVQTSPVDQGLPDTLPAQPLYMRAGLAELGGAEPDFSDRELFAHKVIKRYSACNDIAPGLSGGKLDAVVALHGFNRFDLDESDMAA